MLRKTHRSYRCPKQAIFSPALAMAPDHSHLCRKPIQPSRAHLLHEYTGPERCLLPSMVLHSRQKSLLQQPWLCQNYQAQHIALSKPLLPDSLQMATGCLQREVGPPQNGSKLTTINPNTRRRLHYSCKERATISFPPIGQQLQMG